MVTLRTSSERPLLHAIRHEFAEMPGMCLTRAQFRRLWQLGEQDCDRAIRELIDEGFLLQDDRGRLHLTRSARV
jgi:hypothetical protein